MKLRIIALGGLVGGLLTAALTAVFYLANQLLDLPFIPYDIFNWITRVLPGDLVTFGIDTMIDTMLLLGINVADSAKTAERASAILQFLAIGVVIGAIYFAVMAARQSKGGALDGAAHRSIGRLADDGHKLGDHPCGDAAYFEHHLDYVCLFALGLGFYIWLIVVW